jgi:enoyl-CoA hydratase/carnithine racemase
VSVLEDKIGHVQLNIPSKLNALSNGLVDSIVSSLHALDQDDSVSVIILSGAGKAFCCGADVRQIVAKSTARMYIENAFNVLLQVALIRKPIIAAVHGLAFGGGCELAMMCDVIVAHQDTKFGQPEIKLGFLPGAGGTQRLPRFTNKTKAMEMILTGEPISAGEAKEIGLVSRVSQGDVVQSALEIARLMKRHPLQALIMNKAAVNAAYETSLQGGIMTERAFFHGSGSTKDKEEGIAAFLNKRPAKFTNE